MILLKTAKKAARLFVLVSCFMVLLFLLCSCGVGGVSLGGIDDLLKAPTLNKRQAEISLALQDIVGLSDIIYRYPQGGENRSPFIFHDLDSDGREEAIVFYSLASMPSDIRVKFLRQDKEDKWYSLHESAGKGDQVEFVELSEIIRGSAPRVVIGWMSTMSRERQMEIFSISEEGFAREVLQRYYVFSTVEGDWRTGSRMLIISRDSRNSPFELQLLGDAGGKVGKIDSIWLYEDVVDILQIAKGRLWDGATGVFIDEIWDNYTITTEIVRLDKDGFTLLSGAAEGTDSDQMQYYKETFRPDRLPCVDIDGDGFIEIPKSTYLPGIEAVDEIGQLMLIVYWRPEKDGLVAARSAVTDNSLGYLIFFPDRWLDEVTVVDYPETGQRSFYTLDPKDRLPDTELLRIAVFSAKDYGGDYPQGYLPLAERGIQKYMGYIPNNPDEPLAITEEELRELFSLMDPVAPA